MVLDWNFYIYCSAVYKINFPNQVGGYKLLPVLYFNTN